MTTDSFESSWKELRSRVRPRWTALTDEDVKRVDGKRDVLVELLREKYGFSQLQAENEVNSFLDENGVAFAYGRN